MRLQIVSTAVTRIEGLGERTGVHAKDMVVSVSAAGGWRVSTRCCCLEQVAFPPTPTPHSLSLTFLATDCHYSKKGRATFVSR
jgi:hypothetical protein